MFRSPILIARSLGVRSVPKTEGYSFRVSVADPGQRNHLGCKTVVRPAAHELRTYASLSVVLITQISSCLLTAFVTVQIEAGNAIIAGMMPPLFLCLRAQMLATHELGNSSFPEANECDRPCRVTL